MPLDKVRDDLGVGLRGELVTFLLERRAQFAEVLDDAVEDDGHLLGVAAGERMRIAVRDLPCVAQRV